MNEQELKRKSKFLSLILRHQPEKVNLTLDSAGYVNVEKLLSSINNTTNMSISKDQLDEIVEKNNKKRFAYSEDGESLRASQGHSIPVDLGLSAKIPPDILYHGTIDTFLDGISRAGISKMKRNHVHLSKDKETAINVGSRRAFGNIKVVVFEVDAKTMYDAGYRFFESDNGVWLTNHINPLYIKLMD